MKKLIPLCLTLILALALAVPAAAAEDPGVSVMVDGETVAFPDGAPEISGGRTMVPMRAVLEKLGAKVDYDVDTRTVTATLDDTQLTHVIGTDVITLSPRKLTADSLTAGGEKLTMDAASYVSGGSTMVPLRFFSQALGYEVYWDAGARTAVVINKDAAIAEIDRSFTILNGLQAQRSQTLDGMALDMDFSGEAKLLDSIGGDQTYPVSMKLSALYGPGAVNMEGAMDLSILTPLLDGEDAEAAELLAPALKDLSFRIIYSGETMWMQAPALTDILRQSGAELPEGEVWLKTGMDGLSLDAMGMTDAGASSIGAALYEMAAFADAEVPVNIYDDLQEAARLAAWLMGDDTFVKSGEDYVWELDQEKLDRLSEALGASSVSVPGNMKMTVKADGSCIFDIDLAMDELTLTLSGSSSPSAFSVEGQIRVKNVCDVTFQGEAKIAASSKTPDAAPPADAEVLDLDDLAATPMPLPELPAA